jgi:TonB family protein
MSQRAATWEDFYLADKRMPFIAAFACHAMLFVWNPTMMHANPLYRNVPTLEIKYLDRLPAAPVKKPLPKPVEKHKPKKAHKSGLALHPKPNPAPHISHSKPIPKPKPKPFVSKIVIPKFVPHTMDDAPIAASPAPGISAPAPRRAVQPMTPPQKLKGKSRGIRASDINFELSDRGSLNSASRVVAIPIAEERGEIASLPNAPALHNAPTGRKALAGYRFVPGQGAGAELSGKKGFTGYHGAIKTDNYAEGSMSGSSGKGHTQIGQGFEIGGPVGDRKILKRRLPEYPAWAEEKGITANVVIFFTVKPDGTLRTSMRIERSSGYPELDQLAKDALMGWRFSPTSAGSSENEAWGRITFKFTLT